MKKICAIILSFFIACINNAHAQPHSFALGDSVFLLDNKPFQMISGEMHYSRIPREAWRQRMKMARAMGLNTIGTYVFWNVQEPEKGKFEFSGNSDIAAFVKTAQEEGLWVVLRPSPYVCAEWEFGGYPYWLQNENGLVVRSKEKKYLKEYKNYLMALGKQLAPLQINHGGNILMIQIENEYGSYGSDKNYLEINQKIFRDAGFDGLLYTCDPVNDIAKGYLPGLLPAVNGTDDPQKIKQLVRKYHNGKGPYYIAEWYPAWFDWWGTSHHVVPAEKYAAPLDEAGNATPKFMAFRSVIQKHLPAGETLPEVPAAKPVTSIDEIHFTEATSIFSVLSSPKINPELLSFEDLHQAYGFMLYRTTLNGGEKGKLVLKDLRDYALVFINGKRAGVLDRRHNDSSIGISMPKGKVTLDILVENLGRVNFGPYLLKNKKGITQKVLFNNKELKNWQMFSLPFNNVNTVKKNPGNSNYAEAPVIRKGTFNLSKVGDAYLDMSKWGKGVVWVNGYNLGRYWNVGQTTPLPHLLMSR